MKNNQTPAQIWRAFLQNESAELAAVAKSVIKQLGCGVTFEGLTELHSVTRCSCGAAGGFSGFVYYSDTVAFWRKNRAKITALMNYEADGLGEGSAFDMVSRFRSLKDFTPGEIGRALYGNFCDDLTQIYNTFAWYALEEVSYRFGEFCYDQDIDIYNC